MLKEMYIGMRQYCSFCNQKFQTYGTKCSRMGQVNFFRSCLPQILLDSFLNTFSHKNFYRFQCFFQNQTILQVLQLLLLSGHHGKYPSNSNSNYLCLHLSHPTFFTILTLFQEVSVLYFAFIYILSKTYFIYQIPKI